MASNIWQGAHLGEAEEVLGGVEAAAPDTRQQLVKIHVARSLRTVQHVAADEPPAVAHTQGLTLVPILAQLELFCPPYNPT